MFIVSCSGNKSSTTFNEVSLNEDELEAKSLLESSLVSLNTSQYQIDDSDFALLDKEGLLTDEEKKSLKIIK